MIEHRLFGLSPRAPCLKCERSHPAASENQGPPIHDWDLGKGIGPRGLVVGAVRVTAGQVICCDFESRLLRLGRDVWRETSAWMWR